MDRTFFFKVFIEFVKILLLCFYVLVFWSQGMWDLCSPTRDQTVPCTVRSTCTLRCCCWVASVVSSPVRPHRGQSTRLLCPWDSPGKNTGVGCHFCLPCMLHHFSRVRLCATLWTAANQAPLSLEGKILPQDHQGSSKDKTFNTGWIWAPLGHTWGFLVNFDLKISIDYVVL